MFERKCEYEDIPYLLSEVDRLNALHKREIIITGEYAQRVIDLTARAEKAEAERDKAVEIGDRLCEEVENCYGRETELTQKWCGQEAGKEK